MIYVFAIVLTHFLAGNPGLQHGEFDSVAASMNTLLVQGIFADQEDTIAKMLTLDWAYYFLFLLYMFLGSFTLMNMLIGVVCEIISETAAENREDALADA